MANSKKVLPVDESKMQENSVISGKNIVGLARTVAGIVGKGAQHVAEDYKAQGVGAKMASNDSRALKAANGPSLAPKEYKPDVAGRAEVKRYAAPLKNYNGDKNAMRMGAQAVEAGRSSLAIPKAPINKGK